MKRASSDIRSFFSSETSRQSKKVKEEIEEELPDEPKCVKKPAKLHKLKRHRRWRMFDQSVGDAIAECPMVCPACNNATASANYSSLSGHYMGFGHGTVQELGKINPLKLLQNEADVLRFKDKQLEEDGFRAKSRMSYRWPQFTSRIAVALSDMKMRCPKCAKVVSSYLTLMEHNRNICKGSTLELRKFDPITLLARKQDVQNIKELIQQEKDGKLDPSQHVDSSSADNINYVSRVSRHAGSTRWPQLPKSVEDFLITCRMQCPKCKEISKSYNKLTRHCKEKSHGTFKELHRLDPFDLVVNDNDKQEARRLQQLEEQGPSEASTVPIVRRPPIRVKRSSTWPQFTARVVDEIRMCRMRCNLCELPFLNYNAFWFHYRTNHGTMADIRRIDPLTILANSDDVERFKKQQETQKYSKTMHERYAKFNRTKGRKLLENQEDVAQCEEEDEFFVCPLCEEFFNTDESFTSYAKEFHFEDHEWMIMELEIERSK